MSKWGHTKMQTAVHLSAGSVSRQRSLWFQQGKDIVIKWDKMKFVFVSKFQVVEKTMKGNKSYQFRLRKYLNSPLPPPLTISTVTWADANLPSIYKQV